MGNTNSLYPEAEEPPESFSSGVGKGLCQYWMRNRVMGWWGGERKELGPNWKGREDELAFP